MVLKRERGREKSVTNDATKGAHGRKIVIEASVGNIV